MSMCFIKVFRDDRVGQWNGFGDAENSSRVDIEVLFKK